MSYGHGDLVAYYQGVIDEGGLAFEQGAALGVNPYRTTDTARPRRYDLWNQGWRLAAVEAGSQCRSCAAVLQLRSTVCPLCRKPVPSG